MLTAQDECSQLLAFFGPQLNALLQGTDNPLQYPPHTEVNLFQDAQEHAVHCSVEVLFS